MTLADVRALVERMTPGPFGLREKDGGREVTLKRRHWELGSRVTKQGVGIIFGATDTDAQGLVALRTLAPALLDVAEAGRTHAALCRAIPFDHGAAEEACQRLEDALAALDRAMEEMK